MGFGFMWLISCLLCGHRALVRTKENVRWEKYRHYHYCHKNISIDKYYESVITVKIREDKALLILYPALMLTAKNRKPPIKVSV